MAVSRRDAPSPSTPPAASGGGLEISTLVITALASAGAAIVSSRLFGAGTLVSAALTPVVIAVLKEALDRPRRVVADAVPAAVALPRRRLGARDPGAPGIHAGPDGTPASPGARPRGRAGAQAGPLEPSSGSVAPPEPRGDEEIRVYRSTRRRWRLAIITGLLGFALAAAVLTVTELAAGGAVGRDSRATTYFGGSERSAAQDDTRTTPGEQDSEGGTTTPRDAETTPPDASRAPQDPAATTPTTPAPAPGEPAPPATSPTPAPEGPAPTPTPAPTPPPTPAPPPAPGGEAAPPAAP